MLFRSDQLAKKIKQAGDKIEQGPRSQLQNNWQSCKEKWRIYRTPGDANIPSGEPTSVRRKQHVRKPTQDSMSLSVQFIRLNNAVFSSARRTCPGVQSESQQMPAQWSAWRQL